MSGKNKDSGRWFHRFSYLWAGTIVFISVVTYGVGFALNIYVLRDIAATVASGAIAAILFNWLTQYQAEQSIGDIVSAALERTVRPIRNHAAANSLRDYKYYIRIEKPKPSDSAPDYLVQLVKLSYYWPDMPRRVKIVCAISTAGGALIHWSNDVERGLLWKIENPGSKIDVEDSTVFSIIKASVSKRDLSEKSRTRHSVNGGSALEVIFDVPEDLVGSEGLFDAEVRVRMYDQPKGRMYTSNQLYRPIDNGDFIYIVSDEIRVKDITPVMTEMTPLLPGKSLISDDVIWESAKHRNAARIIIHTPMNKGSGIRFEWYKE